MNKLLTAFLMLIMVALAGCASSPRIWITPEHDKAIAAEFVEWMTRDRNFPFRSETVQIRRGQGTFGDTLKSNMRTAGYFIQTIPDHFVAPNMVSYEATFLEGGKGRSVKYTVRVGQHEVSRKYRARSSNGKWAPVDDFEVTRVDPLERPREDELIAGSVSTIPVSTKSNQKIEPTQKRLSLPSNVDPVKFTGPSGDQITHTEESSDSDFASAIKNLLSGIENPQIDETTVAVTSRPVRVPINKASVPTESNDQRVGLGAKDSAMLAMERRMLGKGSEKETEKPTAVTAISNEKPVKLFATTPVRLAVVDESARQESISASPQPPVIMPVKPIVNAVEVMSAEIPTPAPGRRLKREPINLLGFGQPIEDKEIELVPKENLTKEPLVRVGEPLGETIASVEVNEPNIPAEYIEVPTSAKGKPPLINLLGF